MASQRRHLQKRVGVIVTAVLKSQEIQQRTSLMSIFLNLLWESVEQCQESKKVGTVG